ncbi:MAG: HNH endonuclease, partial [Corynebacterium sp.]|nr:HNH endonuclease [Corynebacterium sp.]
MDELMKAFKLLTSKGIGFLRLCAECSPYDLADDGIEISLAKKYAKLADTLFSPCDSPRIQRETIALAEERQLSVNHLLMINKHARKLKARGAAWKLRAELIAREGSLEEVEAYAKT